MTDQKKKNEYRFLLPLLVSAFAVRLILAAVTEGYPYDMSCFVAWGNKLVSEGAANFYSDGYFADYPPGYLWVLGLVSAISQLLGFTSQDGGTYLLLAFVPALCDCAAAALIWRMGREMLPREGGKILPIVTAFAAFNPLMIFDTGIWKQIDGAFLLPLLLCFWMLERKKMLPAALMYGIALAIKPQALLAGPVLAVCYIVYLFSTFRNNKKELPKAVLQCVLAAALALFPVLLAGLPFYGLSDLVPSLIQKYVDTTSSYPYATINAFNWFAALGGNWQPLTGTAILGIYWKTLGVIHVVLMTAALGFFAVRSAQKKRFSPVLLAAFYLMGIFTFSHCMHERYLAAGVVMTLLAAVVWNDRRLYGAGIGFSLVGLINLSTVYTLVGTDDEWLTTAASQTVCRVFGLAETLCFVWMTLAVYELIENGRKEPLVREETSDEAENQSEIANCLLPRCGDLPHWTKREAAGLAVLTLFTAVISFAYLGDSEAPQNGLTAENETLSATVSLDAAGQDAAYLWIYPGITYGGNLTVTDSSGNTVYSGELLPGGCFCWVQQQISVPAGETLTVSVTNGTVYELAFRDAENNLLSVSGGDALFDEQEAVPEQISQLNSMYFDEIYHGRTGYEMLHRLNVYETTHPPLGKDFIMLGIAIFGMTGFGWRFSGTLFGVLLIPLTWCFARRLTGKPWIGAVAATLLAFDFMRFSQSRIATIDIYATFFIVLGAYFMLWYLQSVQEKGVCGSLLPMALGGIAFGLGCASKWTGIYSGAGLAVLFFLALYWRWKQKPENFGREFWTAAAGGVCFYIVVPLCIYIASYLPYWWRNPDFDLKNWWDCQTLMYNYHSQLEATHPFESRWYTWLLNLRPVWYYSNVNLPESLRGSIAGMGGFVIWLVGLGCLLHLLWRQLTGRGSRAAAVVLVMYAAQLVPWILVSRCTFLYHYFPGSQFCLAAIALTLAQCRNERRAKRAAVVLCAASAVLFAAYYPVLSGLPVAKEWALALEILPSYGFYLA